MISKLLLPLILAISVNVISVNAFARLQPDSQPVGSEENQYAFLWKNRIEIFGMCLRPEEQCALLPEEAAVLQAMQNAAKQWKPFRFYLPEAFVEQSKNLLGSVKVPFVSFSPTPEVIIFEQTQLADEKNKFNYDKKLFLLAAIAAQHAGIPSAQANTTIQKLVGAWQVRWMKLDLADEKEKDINVLYQFGSNPSVTLFDNTAVYDLVEPLKPNLRCSQGVKALQFGPAAWTNHSKTETGLFATLSGKVRVECASGEAFQMNYGIDMPFMRSPLGWTLLYKNLKFHISSGQN